MIDRAGQRLNAADRTPFRPAVANGGPLNLSSVLLVSLLGVLGVLEAQMFGPATPLLPVATVLLAATLFGAIPGLVALAIFAATLGPGVGSDIPADAAYRLGIVAAAALACGGYSDLVRRQMRQSLTLRQAAAPLGVPATALPQIANDPESLTPREETQRGLASLCIVGVGAALTVLFGDLLGPTTSGVLVIATSVLAGSVVGPRFGLFAGFTAWAAIGRLSPQQNLFETALGMATVGAIGWGSGLLAEGRRQAQKALDTLIVAGRELSAVSGEADIRRGLVESLALLSPRSRVQLSDGRSPEISHQPSGGGDWSASDPRWRTRVLAVGDREVGLVRWWFPGSGRQWDALNVVAMSLADLAASAIVRERANVERDDLELVARTEHLRTILLDAVAHHLRSPLAGVLGSVTSILNLPPDHDPTVTRELLFIIKDQANRLSRYVDKFLSVARLESGAMEVSAREVHLEAFIYDLWETFGETGGARRFLTADIGPSTILTDPNLLTQAVGNVLENAIKYSPEETIVDVRAFTLEGNCVIEVRDEGAGIPEERMSRIFERFYRYHSERAPGLGLGLYITKSIVELLGGRVEARNREGCPGLLVTIAIPLQEQQT
jgi:two-component system sensor histidine kinase KdpD